jgi:hypothetical protein
MGTIPVGSGLAAQLVVKDESTYGVAPALTSGIDSFEFDSDTLGLKITRVDGSGLAAGRVYKRAKRSVLTNFDSNGDVVMKLPTRNLGFWLRYMVGDFAATPTEIATSGIYQTVFQPVSSLKGHSFTLQKGAPATDETVEPFTYVGCKLSGWELSVATGGIGMLTQHIDARNELAGAGNGDPLNGAVPALATWVPTTSGLGMSVFHFREATLYTGGTPTLAGGNTLSPPSVPSSGVNATNSTGLNVWVTITGGTLTAVTVNGSQVGTTAGSYLLPARGTISITYSVAPTWTWKQAVVSLAGATAAGQVKDVALGQTYSLDANRIFVGTQGFKGEQIEAGDRGLTGSFTVEWQSSEAYYNAYAANTTNSLELKFVGDTVGGQTYLLDIVVPAIKFNGESQKIPGPAVLTQAINWEGYDDETTVPLQITYQSEDISF